MFTNLKNFYTVLPLFQEGINLNKVKGSFQKFCLILGMILCIGEKLYGSSPYSATLPTGFYVGMEGGVNQMSVNVNEQVAPRDRDEINLSGTGFIGNVLLGWTNIYNQWYMGLEGFAGLNTAQDQKDSLLDSTNHVVAKRELKQQYQFGGAIHLGRQVYNTLLFIRLGAIWSEFKFSREQFVSNIAQNDEKTNKKILPGFQPGFGMAVKLSDCLMFKSLFTYTFYKPYTLTSFERGTTSDLPRLSIKPRAMAFTVGLEWYFNSTLKFW